MTEKQLLCRNCRHYQSQTRLDMYREGYRIIDHFCTRLQHTKLNLVTGDSIKRGWLLNATLHRKRGGWLTRLLGHVRCGPEGRFYEEE